VVKKDGRREEFSRAKLLGGLVMASKKRDLAQPVLEQIADDIENEVRSKNALEIQSRFVGEMVMERLRDLDEIAYIRFASVYRSFKDVEDLRATIEDVLAHPPSRSDSRRRRRPPKEDGGELSLDLGS